MDLTKTPRVEPSVLSSLSKSGPLIASGRDPRRMKDEVRVVTADHMTFGSAILICFSKYATFSGRSKRSEYWQFVLAFSVLAFSASILDVRFALQNKLTDAFFPLVTITSVAFFFPMFAAAWRRMHDLGKSGWASVVPQALGIAMLTSPLWVSYMLTDVIGTKSSALLLARGRHINSQLPELFYALLFLSFVVYFLPLWWLTRPSQPGPNRYGPNPLEATP